MNIEAFVAMLLRGKQDFEVRYCWGEDPPLREVLVIDRRNHTPGIEDPCASFTFAEDGTFEEFCVW